MDITCHLIVNFLGEREIALQEQDISFDDEISDSPESLDPNLDFNINSQKRFKCYMCEDSECVQSNICVNAITVKRLIFFYLVFSNLHTFFFVHVYHL